MNDKHLLLKVYSAKVVTKRHGIKIIIRGKLRDIVLMQIYRGCSMGIGVSGANPSYLRGFFAAQPIRRFGT